MSKEENLFVSILGEVFLIVGSIMVYQHVSKNISTLIAENKFGRYGLAIFGGLLVAMSVVLKSEWGGNI